MKDIKNFINESVKKNYKMDSTVGDFALWACFGNEPDDKEAEYKEESEEKEMITKPEYCQGLLDNGWFKNFDDSDPDKACEEIANFLKNNWNKQIKVKSHDSGNDWEVSFVLNRKTYMATFVTPYDPFCEYYWEDNY